jgi:hypothetical protein
MVIWVVRVDVSVWQVKVVVVAESVIVFISDVVTVETKVDGEVVSIV